MLSRVAERMYWFGRYVERIENTARLISVNTNLVLDLPHVKYIWGSLLSITGYEKQFFERFSVEDERNIIKFLLDDDSCSIMMSVRMARENARTTREIMPNEAWEKINRLYLYLQKNIQKGVKRDGRHQLLKDITAQCQELNGYLAGCMSADEAWAFMKIGSDLERADMTTRILDVGCLNLLNTEHPEIREQETILWMNVLQSLTAYQMYRQHVDDTVNGEDVAAFLLLDEKFPRSVAHCLYDVNEAFRSLPNHEMPLKNITQTQRNISHADIPKLLGGPGLHKFIDDLQSDMASIHGDIAATWFGYDN
ncbi:MAG: alpha-E domain-containing protein [Pseudomonadales bacterium]|nr:alpha-E domain-containing protein [Pseudomonadales bacterium]MBO6655746.1 alpha-E domain-containing protein [Pseudomonadales bacterium]MBO6701867.1 alpha-E domain-containing protein [Pseudomonadales bacterium]MBO7005442.1 alpha-E domain-containing protein [Pseudomonadales bacterium]